MRRGTNRFLTVFPWYSGLTGDLLFYIAVDTLFLTLVKNFSPAEIVSITALSQMICIALQFPVLFIIKKIGNTAAVRSGAFFLLLSATFITFGKSYYLVLLGRIFHDVASIFKSAAVVALENNLDLLDRRSEFVRYRTSANTVYAVITMLISFVASYMFNLNHYLPMIGCITTCTLGFILSLFMKDYSEYNKITYNGKSGSRVKIHYNKLVIIAIVLYALFYSIVVNGQSEGKLFIQQNILLEFDVEQTSLIIGAIICASRVIRVLSNVVFEKLYKKYQNKMGMALSSLLGISIALLLFGSLIPQIVVKIVVMGVGYTIILFIRDPFKLYMQDVLFTHTPKEQHQTLLTVLEFGVKIATAGIGLGFSAILLGSPMIVIIAIMLAISIIEIVLSFILYRALLNGKAQQKSS
ncbi:MAG: hypothetical protein IJW49_03210 [Clostridia bacterium]|nr:hypothetical protein [Clostridia bacterium]